MASWSLVLLSGRHCLKMARNPELIHVISHPVADFTHNMKHVKVGWGICARQG